jgi:hypothetical protein
MAKRQQREAPEGPPEARVPPPVPQGTESVESLGWVVDDLIMGHRRQDRRLRQEVNRLSGEKPDDPPPSEPPPPVPGGTEPVTRGAPPHREKRR